MISPVDFSRIKSWVRKFVNGVALNGVAVNYPKADSAIQPGDNISKLTNDAGFITSQAVSGHDTSPTAHNDIRQGISDVNARVDGISNGISGKADVVDGAKAGNLAGLDANGNLVDSGIDPDAIPISSVDGLTAELNLKASLASADFMELKRGGKDVLTTEAGFPLILPGGGHANTLLQAIANLYGNQETVNVSHTEWFNNIRQHIHNPSDLPPELFIIMPSALSISINIREGFGSVHITSFGNGTPGYPVTWGRSILGWPNNPAWNRDWGKVAVCDGPVEWPPAFYAAGANFQYDDAWGICSRIGSRIFIDFQIKGACPGGYNGGLSVLGQWGQGADRNIFGHVRVAGGRVPDWATPVLYMEKWSGFIHIGVVDTRNNGLESVMPFLPEYWNASRSTCFYGDISFHE